MNLAFGGAHDGCGVPTGPSGTGGDIGPRDVSHGGCFLLCTPTVARPALLRPRARQCGWTPAARNLRWLFTELTIEGIYELPRPQLLLFKLTTKHWTYPALEAELLRSHGNSIHKQAPEVAGAGRVGANFPFLVTHLFHFLPFIFGLVVHSSLSKIRTYSRKPQITQERKASGQDVVGTRRRPGGLPRPCLWPAAGSTDRLGMDGWKLVGSKPRPRYPPPSADRFQF